MKSRNVQKKLALRQKAWQETVRGNSDVIKCLGRDAFKQPGSMNAHKHG